MSKAICAALLTGLAVILGLNSARTLAQSDCSVITDSLARANCMCRMSDIYERVDCVRAAVGTPVASIVACPVGLDEGCRLIAHRKHCGPIRDRIAQANCHCRGIEPRDIRQSCIVSALGNDRSTVMLCPMNPQVDCRNRRGECQSCLRWVDSSKSRANYCDHRYGQPVSYYERDCKWPNCQCLRDRNCCN